MPTQERAHKDAARIEDLFLGKDEPKEDPRTFLLGDFVRTTQLPSPPATLDYTSKVTSFPMYLNNAIGDCAIASPAHEEQIWTSLASTLFTMPDSAVLKAYEDVSGYRPTDPNNPQTNNSDAGCVMLDVMNYWRKTGIGGRQVLAYMKVDPANRVQVKQAIYLFGGLQIGLALPLTAADQIRAGKRWTVVSHTGRGAPGSWGGHAVCVERYTSQSNWVVTWGGLQSMSWGFFQTYCDEAYAVLATDWVSQLSKKAPNGLDMPALQSALSQV